MIGEMIDVYQSDKMRREYYEMCNKRLMHLKESVHRITIPNTIYTDVEREHLASHLVQLKTLISYFENALDKGNERIPHE